MTNEFSQLNLHPSLVQTLAELGYATPTDVQVQVIPLMARGWSISDLIAIIGSVDYILPDIDR